MNTVNLNDKEGYTQLTTTKNVLLRNRTQTLNTNGDLRSWSWIDSLQMWVIDSCLANFRCRHECVS